MALLILGIAALLKPSSGLLLLEVELGACPLLLVSMLAALLVFPIVTISISEKFILVTVVKYRML
jgi:hypothetical protein